MTKQRKALLKTQLDQGQCILSCSDTGYVIESNSKTLGELC